jgi:hypothetical protein
VNKTFCNGCDADLTNSRPALVGERTNGLVGGGMPDGQFHLCAGCGQHAFEALAKRQAAPASAKLATKFPPDRIMTGY